MKQPYLTYRIIIEPDEENTYHAYVPALPGCHTWGTSVLDAKKQIREAIELYVECLVASGETVPEEQSLDTFETIPYPQPA